MHKYIIILTYILFSIIFSSGAQEITFSCCNNFQTSNGTIINSFDNISEWTKQSGTGSYFNDTTNFVEGKQSIMVTSNNTNTNIHRSVNFNFTRNINFWYYVHNASSLKTVKFLVANNSSAIDYYYQEVINTSYEFNNGWNYVSFTPLTMIKSGNPNISDLGYIRLYVTPKTNMWSNVSFDNFRVDTEGKAKAFLTFDDGNSTVNNITSIMSSNNQVGTIFVIPPVVNSSGNYSLSDLQNLRDQGWDISSHSMSHIYMNSLNTTQLDYELGTSKSWLKTYGFFKSSEVFAYPMGEWSEETILNTSKYYKLSRITGSGLYQPHIMNVSNITQVLRILYVVNNTQESQIFDKINATIAENGSVILVGHYYDNSSFTKDSRYTATQTFINISNYLASRSSEIDVIKLSDLLITNVPNNTMVVGNSVKIFSNNTSLINSNNVVNLTTANLFIFPTSDNVVVNVSIWSTDNIYRKLWNEYSENSSVITTHIIGDFPPNTWIQVNLDGYYENRILSDASGYISFIYTGGYSEHQFDLFLYVDPTLSESIAVSKQNTCSGVNDYIKITIPIFGLALMIFAFSIIIIQIRGSFSDDGQANYILIVTSIFIAIVGFGTLIIGGNLVYTILGVTGC